MNKKGLAYLVGSTALASALVVSGTAFAMGPGMGFGHWARGGNPPGVFGTVSAISGNTITITSKGWGPNATSTTYTVDASGATINKDGQSATLSSVAVGDNVMVQGTVSGSSVTATAINDGFGPGSGRFDGDHDRGAAGTVTAISGNTITMTSKGWGPNARQTTYTVDASNATVTKDGTSASVSSVAVGDMIMVTGTTSGTTITATAIRDGKPAMPTPVIIGNGEPVVAGNVTAINGTALTITNKSNVTYTVDASNATIAKGLAKTASLSDITVGDAVVVQGTVNGTSVTATSIIDQAHTPNTQTGTSTPLTRHGRGFLGDFFAGIGNFFHGVFGFF